MPHCAVAGPRHSPPGIACLPATPGGRAAIARAYLETGERGTTIAARHGVSRARMHQIVESVIWAALGVRPPR